MKEVNALNQPTCKLYDFNRNGPGLRSMKTLNEDIVRLFKTNERSTGFQNNDRG